MPERQLLPRIATCVAILASTAVLAAGCAFGQAKDEGVDTIPHRYGRIVEEPQQYASALLVDPWVKQIPVGGHHTFGEEFRGVMRLQVDGDGPLFARDVTLQSPATVALVHGPGQDRAEHLVHGMLDLLSKREGFIRGITLSTSRPGYRAAALAYVVSQVITDGDLTASDKALVKSLLAYYASELSEHSYAWYDPRSTWVNIGPDVSRTIRTFVVSPKRVKARDGIFAAMVLRHEFEHTVTPGTTDDFARYQWLEEGTADTIATWPGAAAATARQFGLPYPKQYERRGYSRADAGYPEWVATLHLLLQGCSIDVTDAKALPQVIRVLQGGKLVGTPARLAACVAREQGLSPDRQRQLTGQILRLQGDPTAARRLMLPYL
jgi:hypothetical protein